MSAKKEIWEECSTLIRKTREGDQISFEKFLRLVTGILRSYLSPRINNEEDREDLIQEILIGLYKAWDSYREDRHPAPWIFAIARYKTIDYLWKKKSGDRVFATDNLEFFASPEPIEEEPEKAREILKKWLDVLDERQKQILTHLKLDGMSVREVSEKTGLSESNVKVITHRAVQKIRKHFSLDL
ncbi:sigma-70 family RNA polymerase sigma factor [Leptospira interrogans]|uniref:RNA polymerase sigma factor n=1 Tax=Leptospira interrogans TaxID=173 RepID=UPI000278457F|nr:sigma-70 family RNA polymerase sigma factor [Leptospira interrogans]EJO76634.1 sigma-70 region 2 [Leptospira interrogans serovar Pomona str. Kennewicki LC82-25]EMF34257.1 sigma-70 region 2 [Leptospira interrogans serovar Pomona str. Fox 32256]EMI70917.1 sigma-70 region 2 [Leptospira interrogans serovar Pomona str. CSL10083]EMJ59160.1 sigma-70 region 2 [Leptospira interrogans serovar Pomona str. CSL4002]